MSNIIKRTTLMVRDMDKSLAWYQNVMAMDVYYDKPFTLSGEGLAAGKAGDLIRLVILKCEHPEIGMIGLMQWVDPVMPAPEVPAELGFGMPTFVVGTEVSSFGSSLAFVDLNGDGYEDVIVGEPQATHFVAAHGRVLAYLVSPARESFFLTKKFITQEGSCYVCFTVKETNFLTAVINISH